MGTAADSLRTLASRARVLTSADLRGSSIFFASGQPRATRGLYAGSAERRHFEGVLAAFRRLSGQNVREARQAFEQALAES
ncbi:hypothetical protein MRBLMI12_000853 [Microbacterium sp. LMI12-1-1.1]|uniref:hypothetical protein n=1 Tax=Microbacterium sp. LMI12-1-1.1 TaxID=3135225 RepID=UPI0034472495